MGKSFLIVVICVLLFGSSCTGVNIAAPYLVSNTNPSKDYGSLTGALTGAYRGGIVVHINTTPGQVANAQAIKIGEACSMSILGLVAIGDSSIKAAKASGSITKVASVEFEQFAILIGVFHRVCTIVAGE